ncbi:MAG: hypothetical protein CVU57_26260 [Deltaproteobacteria bacterium HGW-Deltaproteobacteria-15]|jgi:uncharacterized membrane protein|nr:MAG: hypothetical protein CVU57_26260 [Deltaproteobacteria bacterium HGW-Deltaproteobacteria-15]
MKRLYKHLTRSLIAGIVAILPVGGLIITVGYLESTISSSGLSKMDFYFPGFGLLAAILLIYLIGLGVTTFVGKWIWKKIDTLLDKLPALGRLYGTLKQILGYGSGESAIFYEAVLVPSRDMQSEELGLVTNRIYDENGDMKLVIFVPGAPNPTSGRLLMMDKETVKPLGMPVNDVLKALVSMGKTEIDLRGETPDRTRPYPVAGKTG